MHAAANAFTLIFMYLGLDYPGIPVYVAVMLGTFAVSAVIYFLVLKR